MATTLRFSANINTFNACADRYVLSGYGERLTTEELIKAATQVEGLTGVEVVGLWHVNDDNLEQMHRQIKDAGLVVTCVTPDIWASGKWGCGSFSSNDPRIRRDAIHEVKKSMEWAKQLNCEIVDLWFGQDGYDYPLQADYLAAWDRIIEGTIECAEHVPEVKLVIFVVQPPDLFSGRRTAHLANAAGAIPQYQAHLAYAIGWHVSRPGRSADPGAWH